ncbi:AAA family ATPase [Amycolatopsis magusensis]|uniref:AAA family ATPase n=1 Tax=Amycolatopsis magusensis TaxID=882444 RepID=UPI00378B25D9
MSRPRASVARSEALHQQVARNIRNDIAAGVLRHGQRLPSTRDLASRFDVSVFTINEAMDLLGKEGLIVSKARSARTVNAPDQAAHQEIRPVAPRVVMVGGYPGSGKSELGRILARQTGWPILDKDTLTRFVVEAALELQGLSRNDRESDTYVNTLRPGEYESLNEAMLENLQCGNSAIVTAPFVREFGDDEWVKNTQAQCKKLGAVLTFVWVYCDIETMRTYIRHRGAARDSAKLADWDSYVAGLNMDLRPAAPHVVVDNSTSGAPLDEQARRLLADVVEAEEGK